MGPRAGTNDFRTFVSCSVVCVGGAVLTLPLAAHRGSIIFTIVCIYAAGAFGALMNKVMALSASLAESPFFSDAVAATLVGPVSSSDTSFDATTSATLLGRTTPSASEEATKRQHRAALRIFLDCFNFIAIVTMLVMYLRVIADSSAHIAVKLELGPRFVDPQAYYVPLFCFMTALLSMRTIGEMFHVAVFGYSAIVLIVIAMVLQYLISGSVRADYRLNWFSVDQGALEMLALVVTAAGMQTITPSVYFEMSERSPKRFTQICVLVALTSSAIYGAAALFGYLTFGSAVALPEVGGNIMNNYPDSTVWAVLRCVLVIHFVASIPVVGFAGRIIIHRVAAECSSSGGHGSVASDPSRIYEVDIVARVAASAFIMCVSCIAAAMIPGIGAWLHLSGLLFGLPSYSLLPCCCGIAIYSGRWSGSGAAKRTGVADEYAGSRKMLVLCTIGVIVSSIALVSGIMFMLF